MGVLARLGGRRLIGRGTSPSVGLWVGSRGAQVQLCYRVRDLDRALAAVRGGGGEAQAPEAEPYGRLAECTDPAG